MAERGTLLTRGIHPPLHRIQIQKREGARAGQQRGMGGQAPQETTVDLLDLTHVPPRQAAQERPQRGRGADPVERLIHPAVPQRAQIIDAISASGHPGHHRADFQRRVRPARTGHRHVLADQAVQPATFGQPHHRYQPGIADHVLVIEDRMSPGFGMRDLHLRGVLSKRVLEA